MKNTSLTIRVTESQKAEWQAAADQDLRKLADWIRIALDQAAERDLSPKP